MGISSSAASVNRLPNFSRCRSSTRHAEDSVTGSIHLERAAFQNAESRRALRRENSRPPGLDNSRFLRRDRFDAGAEERFVIEVDRGDDAISGSTTIGGVEPSAEAGFQHHDFDSARAAKPRTPSPSSVSKKLGCASISSRARRRSTARVNLSKAAHQACLGDQFAVDLDAFARIDQMRRSVEPGAEAAVRSAEAIMAQVEPLPLVPATWMKRPRPVRVAKLPRAESRCAPDPT